MSPTASFARSLPITLAFLVLPSIASASVQLPTYPGDNFTLRQDASGAIWREDFVIPVELPAPEPTTPVKPERSDDCRLPKSAISSTDNIENFSPANGRFSKVPAYLVPIYEQACEDYQIPVRYLAADGSYETHFNPKKIGDSGNSCGIHQFNRQNAGKRWPRNWGFADLDDCLNPTSNIRKTAEFWRSMLDKKHICDDDLSCAVRRHNGVNSYGYMRTVMGAADRYYR